MPFTLNEAVVKIRSEGIDKLDADLKKVDKTLSSIGHGTAAKGLNADFRNASRSANKLGESVGKVGNLLAVMPTRGTAAMSGYTGALGTATTAMGGLSIATAGATAGIAALVGVGAGLVAAVKSAGDLERRLAEVATISKDVAGNIKGFSEQIGRLSIATRTDTGLLAEGLYQTISAGITDTGDALKFLEVSANAARAGLSNVGTAVSGLTSAVSAFGLEASDVGLVADKFFRTVEVGKLRFEDIASSIGSVAPLASQLGISLEELLAAGSALTLTGQTLSESFTNIQGVMNAVLRPSNEAVDLAEQLGIEFSATALQTKGLTRFLKDLEIQAGGDVEVLGQLFGRIEGLRGVLALTGNQAESFAKNLDAIQNAAGSAEKAVDIQNQTFEAQIALLKNQLSFALQTIGNELLPAVTEALEDMNAALMGVDWDNFQNDAETAARGIIAAFKGVGIVLRDTGTLVKGIFDIIDFLLIPGGGVPESVSQGASNLGRALTIGATNQNTEFLTSAGLGRPAEGRRVPLVTPDGQTFVPSGAQTTAPLPTAQPTGLGRAIPLTPEQQDLAAQALAVSPDFIRSPAARQARSFRTGGQGGFVAPRAGTGIEAVTRSPIPGVQGELITPTPGDAVTQDQAVQAVSGAVNGLENIADLSSPITEDLKKFDTAIQSASKAAEEARNQFQIPGGFGTVAEGFGFDPSATGQQSRMPIGNLLRGAGENLAISAGGARGGALLQGALSGGAAGGPIGAVVGFGVELAKLTPSFSKIQDSIDNVVGKLINAFDPVISVIADVLEPIFQVFGEHLEALTPIYKALSQILKVVLVPVFKGLAYVLGLLSKAIVSVLNFFISAINVVIGLLNKIPGVNIQRLGEDNERRRPEVDALDPTRQREGGVVAREDRIGQRGETIGGRPRESAIGDARGSSGGLRVSNLTGTARDVFVDFLRPLKQLNQLTVLARLEPILVDIRDDLSIFTGRAMNLAPVGINVPNVQAIRGGQNADVDFAGAAAGGGRAGGGDTFVTVNVNFDNPGDFNGQEVVEIINDELDFQERRRGAGVRANNNRNPRDI